VVLRAPAPNNAVWNVQVTIDGGPPSASDRLVVETPGDQPETVVYTPDASDGGTLNLDSLTSVVTIAQIEELQYDGEADGDSLTVMGTASDDTIVHTPGTGNQEGTFRVNDLLALSYQNLGSGANLTANGAGGTDTLVYNGTATNDSFTIGAALQVNLNSRVVLNTTAVEVLTLEGLDGDDRVDLSGSGNIVISGQVINLGGTIINSHVEATYLTASGTNDLLTYNGVSGVSEDIMVSSSGVAGGGQLSVPGETLVIFSGVEQIDVNGNTTETDTLTFAGTNKDDTFQINLAAAGTNTDPILQLQNSLGTLLTLRNYTGFDTLRVLGLDGADTFNVTVAPSDTSRNLFVDGGPSAGKKKSTDDLNIIYNPPKPKIIRSAATQNPDAGLVDLDYGTARFVVEYNDVEQVTIRKS
jgi:hypothetical protein